MLLLSCSCQARLENQQLVFRCLLASKTVFLLLTALGSSECTRPAWPSLIHCGLRCPGLLSRAGRVTLGKKHKIDVVDHGLLTDTEREDRPLGLE